MSKKTPSNWTTRDLMVTVVIGITLGVVLIPVTYGYVLLLGVGGLIARSLVGGIYFVPTVFASYVMRKPGAALLASTVGGLVNLPTPSGPVVLGVSVLIGVLGELLIWLTTRYKSYGGQRLAIVGITTGLLVYVLILFSALRSAEFEWNSIAIIAAVLSGITFAAAALIAKLLADAVARTGVLANSALGRANIEEV